jgi:hypothetical protein
MVAQMTFRSRDSFKGASSFSAFKDGKPIDPIPVHALCSLVVWSPQVDIDATLKTPPRNRSNA